MNKAELIVALNIACGRDIPKTHIDRVLKALPEVVHHELAFGGEVTLTGLGKFKAVLREARSAHSPLTGAAVEVPAKTVPKFTAAKALKDAVNHGSV